MNSTRQSPQVVRIARAGAGNVVAVFCEAFADYPVMRFVLGDSGADHPSRLETLIRFFVMARAMRNEPMLGIAGGHGLVAAATVSHPGGAASPPELAVLRETTWDVLGPEARARYEACGQAWGPLEIDVPHTHLNMIGVRNSARGKGLASALLEAVQQISRERRGRRASR